jgi:hypothetical protein
MKRVILEIVRSKKIDAEDYFIIRIKEQTHKEGRFGKDGSDTFLTENGIRLSSVGSPQWKPSERKLFLRGWNSNKDDSELTIREKDYYSIKRAVDDYNKTFAFEKGDSDNMIEDSLFEVV